MMEQINKLRDKNGVEIKIGDRVRFYPSCDRVDGTFDGTIVFQDGCMTVDCTYENPVTCVSNPEGWKHEHDWTVTRGFFLKIGDRFDCRYVIHREPITQLAKWGSQEDAKKAREIIKELNLPFDDRILNCEVLNDG